MNKSTPLGSPASSADKLVVLLVDDDEAIREYLRPALTTEALCCLTAGSVAEAVDCLRQNEIALMVLDWGLDKSGAEVLRAAREIRPNLPVIAISGMPFDVRTDAICQRVDAFLHKPLSGEVLHSQVTQLLRRVSDGTTAFQPKRAEEVLPLEEARKIYIRQVVGLFDSNISLAAKALGIHRQTVAAALENQP